MFKFDSATSIKLINLNKLLKEVIFYIILVNIQFL